MMMTMVIIFDLAFDDVDREDQWLGVTVKSQGEGGYAMVCAHRYVHRGTDFRWGNGICYSLTNYLDYGRSYEPCKNRLVDLAHEQYGEYRWQWTRASND